MATNNELDVGLSGNVGTGTFVGSISPTLVTPNIGAATFTNLQVAANNEKIFDSSHKQAVVITTSGGTPVNGIQVNTASTGNAPALQARGGDTNVNLQLLGRGNGGAIIHGITSGSLPPAGYMGELIKSQVLYASAVSMTNAVIKDITSISVTAGNWLINGNVFIDMTGVNTASLGWISTTSATAPDNSKWNGIALSVSTSSFLNGISVPTFLLSVSSTTTVYLSAQSNFSTGTTTGCGLITAIRIG